MKRISALLAAGLLVAAAGAAHAIDNDRIEGQGKQLKGNVEQGVGTVTGNKELEQQGKSDQTKGEIQDTWGKTKDTARDVGQKLKDGVEGK